MLRLHEAKPGRRFYLYSGLWIYHNWIWTVLTNINSTSHFPLSRSELQLIHTDSGTDYSALNGIVWKYSFWFCTECIVHRISLGIGISLGRCDWAMKLFVVSPVSSSITLTISSSVQYLLCCWRVIKTSARSLKHVSALCLDTGALSHTSFHCTLSENRKAKRKMWRTRRQHSETR